LEGFLIRLRVRKLFVLSGFILLGSLFADRGMVPISLPDVSIYEPGQKAIIGWNGREEVMILSTEVYADTSIKVLEILPLPSKPKVEKGDFKAFQKVERLIFKHRPKEMIAKRGITVPFKEEELFVEVIFKERIGPHSITVVKAEEGDDLIRWARNFFKDSPFQFPQRLRPIFERYIQEGKKFFVFDIIEIGKKRKPVEPLIYTFKSKSLYYPLEISSIVKGSSTIQLYILSKGIPNLWVDSLPLEFGYYRLSRKRPILFEIREEEIKGIAPQLLKVLNFKPVYLSVLKYRGPLSSLKGDVSIKEFLKPVRY